MVFVLSLFDAAASIAFLFGRGPTGWGDGACNAQGFFITLFGLCTVTPTVTSHTRGSPRLLCVAAWLQIFWTTVTAFNLYALLCLRKVPPRAPCLHPSPTHPMAERGSTQGMDAVLSRGYHHSASRVRHLSRCSRQVPSFPPNPTQPQPC